MGLFNHQSSYRPPSPHGYMAPPTSRLDGCPVVKWLLIINIVVFLLEMLGNSAPRVPNGYVRGHDSFLWNWGYFSFDQVFKHGQVWRVITFQFLHANGMHIFANMLGMYFFGHFVERWWGSARFLVFYLACGVAGAIFYSLLLVLPGFIPSDEGYVHMIGASAGLYGILIAVALLAPDLKVFLFFVIPMSMRVFAIGVLCFAAYHAFTNGNNAGGEAGHLGGAILGYILMRNPQWLNWADSFWHRYQTRNTMRGGRRVIDAEIVRKPKIRPRTHIRMDDSAIDRILDKVNREGIQSLTDEEREILRRSAEK